MDINRLRKIEKIIFENKIYKALNLKILLVYILFIVIYLSRPNLYKIDNSIVDIIVGSIANFIPSMLFSIIGILHIIPLITGELKAINNVKNLMIVNLINLLVFILIEYHHVIFESGNWGNLDIIATILGIVIASIYYFRVKDKFSDIGNKELL